MKILGAISILTLFISGCSHFSNVSYVGIGAFAACSLIGSLQTPKDESSLAHAGLWGGGCATTAMVATDIYQNRKQKKKIKQRLRFERNSDVIDEVSIKKKLLQSKSFKNLNKSIKNKIKSDWSIYKIDNWVIDHKGGLKHENYEIEFN